MKRKLLTLFLSSIALILNAQIGCTPDPSYTADGIYPDSISGLPNAIVGQSYNEFITIINPADSTLDVASYIGWPTPYMATIDIDDVEIISVTGLPNNFDYACSPSSCAFPGGQISCAELYSTSNPTIADLGTYNIDIAIEVHCSNVPLLSTYTLNDNIDYYTITIVEDGGGTTGLINQYSDNTFKLLDVIPNPVNNEAKIQFITGNQGEKINIQVSDLFGKEVRSVEVISNRGVNTFLLNTSNLSESVYTYTINNGEDILTKRMIIAH